MSVLSTAAPVDLLAYLLLIQFLPLVLVVGARYTDKGIYRYVLTGQTGLIMVFFLAWSGYSKDSWDYLSGFYGNPLDWDSEWLFWIIGSGLDRIVYDPWPLKIVSTLAAAIMCFAVIAFFVDRDWRYSIAGLFALLLTPSFFLLLGSAVRQGLAGAVVALGIVYLYRQRYDLFIVSAITAFFLHQYSVVLALAGVVSRLAPRTVWYLLCIAPFTSFVAAGLGELYGVNLDDHVPYSDKSEGQFHWAKFVVSYILAIGALFVTRSFETRERGIVTAYACIVAFSAMFLKYEVPFERLLGYSEMLLPIVAVVGLSAIRWIRERLLLLWGTATGAGLLLWSHPSMFRTLGYAGG